MNTLITNYIDIFVVAISKILQGFKQSAFPLGVNYFIGLRKKNDLIFLKQFSLHPLHLVNKPLMLKCLGIKHRYDIHAKVFGAAVFGFVVNDVNILISKGLPVMLEPYRKKHRLVFNDSEYCKFFFHSLSN